MIAGPAEAEPRPTSEGPADAEPRPTSEGPADAEPRPTSEAPAEAEPQPTSNQAPLDIAELRALTRPPSGYAHLVGSAAFGRGLRFNNPYRLATQLGDTPESVSLTASYLDLGAAVAFGEPDRIQHGAAVHWSLALTGVAQQVLTPSYFLAYRGVHRFLATGRLGPSIVLTPDPTPGIEIAGSLSWFLTARIALAGELIFDIYYGAGTPDTGVATYPILSGQLGLLIDYEVLP
jgi:hypothetical protein